MKLLNNVKGLLTTIPGILVIVSTIVYMIHSWGSVEWEYVAEGLLMGLGLIIAPGSVPTETRKAFKEKLRSLRKKGVIITLLLTSSFVSNAQLSNSFDTVFVKTIKALSKGSKSDSTLNFVYDDFNANPVSLITVNDTLLREWVGENGGGSKDSSWVSIEVDTIREFNSSNILINASAGSVRLETIDISGDIISSIVGSSVIFNDNIRPAIPSLDVGTSSNQWRDIYTSGTIQNSAGGVTIEQIGVSNSSIFSSSGAFLAVTDNLVPTTDNLYDIGTNDFNEWRTGYFATDIEVRDSTLLEIILANSGGGTPAGLNQQIQFNDGGAFGADGSFIYDNVGKIMTAPHIEPSIDNTYDVGANTNEFRNGYFDGVINVPTIQNPSGSLTVEGVQFQSQTISSSTLMTLSTSTGNILLDPLADLDISATNITTNNGNISEVGQINGFTGSDLEIISPINNNIILDISGTGILTAGNYGFDVNQTVDASTDNYVLTYNNADGEISLEANAGVYTDFVPTKIDSTNIDDFSIDRFFYSAQGNYIVCHVSGFVDTNASGLAQFSFTLPVAASALLPVIGHGASRQHGYVVVDRGASGEAVVIFPDNTDIDQDGFSITIAYRGT